MEIRRIGSFADAEECASIMASSEPWTTLGRGFDDSLALLTSPAKDVFGAYLDETLAGFIVIDMNGPFAGYIQTVAVHEKWRSRGIGRQLVAFAENYIFARSPNVFICVSSFNDRARKLYEDLGFERIGELRDYIVAGHSEILMRKTTGPRDSFRPAGTKISAATQSHTR